MSDKAIDDLERLDRPPPGWFLVNVMRRGDHRKREWVALVIDVDPDKIKYFLSKVAFLYVHPKDFQPGTRRLREAWVNIQGKHPTKDAAWDAAQRMMVTTH